jgi:1,4-alpha-glucan branching enzyme/maltooligosyltrehalose trehalohydrolase
MTAFTLSAVAGEDLGQDRCPVPDTLPSDVEPIAPVVPGLGRCLHAMPFGPVRIDPDDTRSGYAFRLWAPAAPKVDLVFQPASGGRLELPCEKADGGWWHVKVPQARAGDRYGFAVDTEHGMLDVPDPASRYNPDGVHQPSQVLDPRSFDWGDDMAWQGRPWAEAVVYELHVGTFTAEGTYKAAERRLDHLAALGITAIELMPLGSAPGQRGWGYDVVLPYAPQPSYGHPNDLKAFIRAAHARGLMVLLDVVYNHFGPDGNYLHAYAREFFNPAHQTPWGDAINFDAKHAATVRDFYIHNALYWLTEYRFDGLRIDAAHAMTDTSDDHFLTELSRRAREATGSRQIHLVLENNRNEAHHLGQPGMPGLFEAQWNDDFHQAAHVLLTGETHGYYRDFAEQPLQQLVRCLTEGFAFQGEPSAHDGGPRGEPSRDLPASCFINFLQNHDQTGNRAFGERLTALSAQAPLKALACIQLLAPGIPMLFMGEEFGTTAPFHYFCDFQGDLARAVREGRRREHAQGNDGEDTLTVPDPNDPAVFGASTLGWDELRAAPHRDWLSFYTQALAVRAHMVAPRLPLIRTGAAKSRFLGPRTVEITWPTEGAGTLVMRAHLADQPSEPLPRVDGALLFGVGDDQGALPGALGPWSVRLHLVEEALP